MIGPKEYAIINLASCKGKIDIVYNKPSIYNANDNEIATNDNGISNDPKRD